MERADEPAAAATCRGVSPAALRLSSDLELRVALKRRSSRSEVTSLLSAAKWIGVNLYRKLKLLVKEDVLERTDKIHELKK